MTLYHWIAILGLTAVLGLQWAHVRVMGGGTWWVEDRKALHRFYTACGVCVVLLLVEAVLYWIQPWR